MRNHLLVLLTIVAMAILGCATADKSDESIGSTGRSSVALTSSSGDCVVGTIEIRNAGGNVASSFDTDCTDVSHEVILLPGDYTITMVAGYTCVPADPTGYVECEYVTSDPSPFTVVVNEVTDVALQFRFSYENTDDEMILFSVGGANVVLDPPENEERCGTGPACADGDICATVDGQGPECYTVCVTGDECAVDVPCIAVGAMEDQGPDAPMNLCIIGAECDLETSFHLCVPGGGTGSAEVCNGVDDDLDGFADNGPGMLCVQGRQTVCSTVCSTLGLSLCDVNCQPGACVPPSEACNNGIDDDCNGDADCLDIACVSDPACTTPNCIDLEMVDGDGDGYSVTVDCGPLDCDDQNAAIHPGVTEVCNGIDDNCVNGIDEGNVCGTGGTGTGGAFGVGGDTGTGGEETGGASGAGGDTGTGGDSGLGGSGGSAGGLVEVTFVFTGPATYGGPSGSVYLGGDIYVYGYSPGSTTMTWGPFCNPIDDVNDSLFDLTCTKELPVGREYVVQIQMVVAGAPDGFIHYGDKSYTPNGGHGVTLGSLSVYVDGVLTNVMLVESPAYNPSADPPMDTYNASFRTPPAP